MQSPPSTQVPTRLKRRPFMTPVWIIGVVVLLSVCVMGLEAWFLLTADSTTVVVIRHAEKESNAGDDPPLSPTGRSRAELLARMFGDARAPGHIDAIYVSPTQRNAMTAAPLAAALGIVPIVAPARDLRGLAHRVLREQSGRRVLIVGHSDTVPELVRALTGVKAVPPIGDEEYGTLYVVTVPRIGRADFLRMTY